MPERTRGMFGVNLCSYPIGLEVLQSRDSDPLYRHRPKIPIAEYTLPFCTHMHLVLKWQFTFFTNHYSSRGLQLPPYDSSLL